MRSYAYTHMEYRNKMTKFIKFITSLSDTSKP
jgi:hypothetical protein